MVQVLIFIAIIAIADLFCFKNKVNNRRMYRITRLAERQEELIELLKEKNKNENES